jgi:hypothetical protein
MRVLAGFLLLASLSARAEVWYNGSECISDSARKLQIYTLSSLCVFVDRDVVENPDNFKGIEGCSQLNLKWHREVLEEYYKEKAAEELQSIYKNTEILLQSIDLISKDYRTIETFCRQGAIVGDSRRIQPQEARLAIKTLKASCGTAFKGLVDLSFKDPNICEQAKLEWSQRKTGFYKARLGEVDSEISKLQKERQALQSKLKEREKDAQALSEDPAQSAH